MTEEEEIAARKQLNAAQDKAENIRLLKDAAHRYASGNGSIDDMVQRLRAVGVIVAAAGPQPEAGANVQTVDVLVITTLEGVKKKIETEKTPWLKSMREEMVSELGEVIQKLS